MHQKAFIGLISLLAIKVSNGEETTQQCAADSNDKTCKAQQEPNTCKFYLAPSSIPNAGFGVYTTQPIAKNDPLTQTADAPSVMVFDAETHYAQGERNWNMENYFWSGEGSGQFECAVLEEYVVTFGTSCNFHTYLKNIFPIEADYSDTITPRSGGSPGIGAYSYYGGAQFHASRDIAAGEEIFADYGEDWLDSRDYLEHIPREEDYRLTAEVILKLVDGLDEEEIDDSFLTTISEVVKLFNERIPKSTLPQTADALQSLLKKVKGDLTEDSIALQLGFQSLTPRDMDWIVSEGKCLDNLVPKVSTVKDAGRGGFAQRFIPKGETIIIAPLLHIMDNESTLMFPLDVDEEGEITRQDENDGPTNEQLITNYCFSHDESSMLMCAQTNAILINHCSTRNSYSGDCLKYNQNENVEMRGANAEIRWAEEWDSDTKAWLKKTIKQIDDEVKKGRRGLSLEVVAKRDIYPGDEVFIDYGEQWEIEWDAHVQNWIPPSDENYIPLDEARKEEVIRTVDEQEYDPYPENILVACNYWVEEDEMYEDDMEDFTEAEDWVTDGSDIAKASLDRLNNTHITYWPCDVLSREKAEDGSDIYEVELFLQPNALEHTVWSVNEYRRILSNYTRETIMLVNDQYTSDQHLEGTFRSFQRIPDEMFPQQWKDKLE